MDIFSEKKIQKSENIEEKESVESVISKFASNTNNVGIKKTLEKISITGEISDPLSLFENLNIIRQSISQFKKSVREVERIVEELKSYVIKEYQDLENQKDVLIKKTTSEKDASSEYNKKTKEIEVRTENLNAVIEGEATFCASSDHINEYEVNMKTGEYVKLKEYEPHTELIGWDREEAENGQWKEINNPSSQIINLSDASWLPSLPVKLNDERGFLSQNQKELIKEILRAIIVQNQKEINEIPNQAEEERASIQINENKTKELLDKLKVLRDRNSQMFPDLYSVKLRKRK